jgi:hypothetical protein
LARYGLNISVSINRIKNTSGVVERKPTRAGETSGISCRGSIRCDSENSSGVFVGDEKIVAAVCF